ncbi:MAG: sensor histidine kinase, partial [Sphingomonadaceae bacterium]
MDKDQDDAPRAQISHRVALLSIVGFWLFYFTIITFRAAGLGYDHQVVMLGYRAGVTVVAMGLTFLVYLFLRRAVRHSLKQAIIIAALLAVPAAISYSVVNWQAFKDFDQRFESHKKDKTAKVVIHKTEEEVPSVAPAPPALPQVPAGNNAAPPAPPA